MLRGPLGLAHHHPLLYIVVLPFSHVSSEDYELMQLETVFEGNPQMRMPSHSHLAVYSSPQVMLVHLAADLNPLGLLLTRQEVLQEFVHLGHGLVMLLPGFSKHLSCLLNFHLTSFLVLFGIQTHMPNRLVKVC